MDVLPPILEGHTLRVQMFLRALHDQNPFPAHALEEDAEDYCHLGRWLRGEGDLNYGQLPGFEGLLTRHGRIHQFARTAKFLLDAGDADGAIHQGNLLDLENRLLLAELLSMAR